MSDRKPIFIMSLGYSLSEQVTEKEVENLKKSDLHRDYHVMVVKGRTENTEFKLFSTEGLKDCQYGEIKEMIDKLTLK